VFLTDGKNETVMLDAAEYEKQMHVLDTLQKLGEADEDSANGRVRTHGEVFARLREKNEELKRNAEIR
jgi:hypothetical protein